MIAFYILAPIMVLAALGHPVRAQGRARRAAAGGGDDLAGDPVRRPRGAVPLRGADHRLHRRDPDAVPLRADAGRRRRLRLGGRDDPRPAAVRDPGRADPRRDPGRRRRPDHASAPWSASRRPTSDGNIEALANILFSRYVFAFEVTSALLITAAVGAMVLAHRERLTPKPTQAAAGRRAGPLVRRDRPAPRPAAAPGRLRPAQRGRHPGAAARRHASPRPRSPGCWRPAARSAPAPRDVEAVQRSIDFAPDAADDHDRAPGPAGRRW